MSRGYLQVGWVSWTGRLGEPMAALLVERSVCNIVSNVSSCAAVCCQLGLLEQLGVQGIRWSAHSGSVTRFWPGVLQITGVGEQMAAPLGEMEIWM